MARLKKALDNEYENDAETDITIHMPKNTEKVRFHFRGEKNAKVVGSLAHNPPKEIGLLRYHLITVAINAVGL